MNNFSRLTAQQAIVGLIIVTVLCGVAEFAMHQNYRSGANVPQIEIAQGIAKLLTLEVEPKAILEGAPIVDIRTSLAPWAVIYDAQGAPVASTARLDNTVPSIPAGVFTYVAAHGEDHITWEPQDGVRQAIVVVGAGEKGFAVSGRNLREVEVSQAGLLKQVVSTWLILVVLLGAWYFVTNRRSTKR